MQLRRSFQFSYCRLCYSGEKWRVMFRNFVIGKWKTKFLSANACTDKKSFRHYFFSRAQYYDVGFLSFARCRQLGECPPERSRLPQMLPDQNLIRLKWKSTICIYYKYPNFMSQVYRLCIALVSIMGLQKVWLKSWRWSCCHLWIISAHKNSR